MTTYYVREDGTAANKAAATDPTSVATSMSPATFNSETFSANDIVVFSSRGGVIDTTLTLPSSGTSGNLITYKGESGFIPTVSPSFGAGIVAGKDYITIDDLILNESGIYGLHYPAGTFVGNVTNDLEVDSPDSEGVRHEGTVTVTHNNLTVSGVNEPLTSHGGGTITILDGSIADYTSSGAVRGTGSNTAVWDIRDTTFEAASGGLLIGSTNRSLGAHTFLRCVIKDLGATRGWDLRSSGILTMKNCIVIGMTSGDFYILPANNSIIVNNTFIGTTGYKVGTDLIFNNSISGAKFLNNIFYNVTDSFYNTTGTIDYNLFYSAGTVRGTNTVTTDPSLDADGKIQTAGSSAVNAGVGPTEGTYDAYIPTDDIDKDTRSGSTCDLGADEFSVTGLSINVFESITTNENLGPDLPLPGLSKFESVTISEFRELLINIAPSVFESMTVSEFIQFAVTIKPNLFDQITISEVVSLAQSDMIGEASQGIDISEVVSLVINILASVHETINITEFITTEVEKLDLDASASDLVQIVETVMAGISISLNIFDLVQVVEHITTSMNLGSVSASETITLSEYKSIMVGIAPSVFDAMTITEFHQLLMTLGTIGTSDTVNVTESAAAELPLALSLSDLIQVVEYIRMEMPELLSVSDLVQITESIVMRFDWLLQSVHDQINILETITALLNPILQSASDSITITEYIMVRKAMYGILNLAFQGKQPSFSMVGKKPGMTFVGKD